MIEVVINLMCLFNRLQRNKRILDDGHEKRRNHCRDDRGNKNLIRILESVYMEILFFKVLVSTHHLETVKSLSWFDSFHSDAI